MAEQETTQEVEQVTQPPSDSGNQKSDEGRNIDDPYKLIDKLRNENASRRVEGNKKDEELEALRKKIDELSPAAKKLAEIEEAAKSEEQKLREKLEALEAAQLAAQSEAQRVKLQNKIILLANKAGIDPELALLLDPTKLDLENEEAALETLQKLAPAPKKSTGGSVVNPSSDKNSVSMTDEQRRKKYFDRRGMMADSIWNG